MLLLKRAFNKYGRFDFLYMFVMVIYMAQATPETSRMVGSISGNPIPFLIPIVLTFILCRKHPISFNNRNLYIRLPEIDNYQNILRRNKLYDKWLNI